MNQKLSYEQRVARAKEHIREVTPDEAKPMLGSATVFLDVREQNEWNLVRIPGAVHVPLSEFPEAVEKVVPRDADVVIYCARGNRSALAAEQMEERGYEKVASMAGGIGAWARSGGAIEQ